MEILGFERFYLSINKPGIREKSFEWGHWFHWYWISFCIIKIWRCQLKRCGNMDLLKRTNLNCAWEDKWNQKKTAVNTCAIFLLSSRRRFSPVHCKKVFNLLLLAKYSSKENSQVVASSESWQTCCLKPWVWP